MSRQALLAWANPVGGLGKQSGRTSGDSLDSLSSFVRGRWGMGTSAPGHPSLPGAELQDRVLQVPMVPRESCGHPEAGARSSSKLSGYTFSTKEKGKL